MPTQPPPPPTEADRLYTSDELAERWHLGRSTIDRLRIRGQLRAVRIGRVWRFRAVDTEAYLRERAENADGG